MFENKRFLAVLLALVPTLLLASPQAMAFDGRFLSARDLTAEQTYNTSAQIVIKEIPIRVTVAEKKSTLELDGATRLSDGTLQVSVPAGDEPISIFLVDDPDEGGQVSGSWQLLKSGKGGTLEPSFGSSQLELVPPTLDEGPVRLKLLVVAGGLEQTFVVEVSPVSQSTK